MYIYMCVCVCLIVCFNTFVSAYLVGTCDSQRGDLCRECYVHGVAFPCSSWFCFTCADCNAIFPVQPPGTWLADVWY